MQPALSSLKTRGDILNLMPDQFPHVVASLWEPLAAAAVVSSFIDGFLSSIF